MTANTSSSVRDSKHDRRRARDQRGLTGAAVTARPDRLPPAPRERRPLLAALAVLLIVGGAATAGLLALRSDERVPVLVAARDIAAGEAITSEALTTTPVAAEGTDLIPASQSELLSGRYARGAISAGQLLDTAMLTENEPLQAGSVAVGAVLDVGRMPASGLEPGDVVQLVAIDDPQGLVLVPDAVVSSVRTEATSSMGASDGSTVTFIVEERFGAHIAAVAAAGNLAAVLVTRGATAEDG